MSEHTAVRVTVWCAGEVQTFHISAEDAILLGARNLNRGKTSQLIFLTFPSCLQFPPFHGLLPVLILLTSSNTSPTFRSVISSRAVV